MKLSHLGSKIMYDFKMMSPQEIEELDQNTKAWEKTCQEDSEDTIRRFYYLVFKKYPPVQYVVAACYFFLSRYLADLLTKDSPSDFLLDDDDLQ